MKTAKWIRDRRTAAGLSQAELLGRVYNPSFGSGGMFVSSERFVRERGGRRDDISIYGQESNLLGAEDE